MKQKKKTDIPKDMIRSQNLFLPRDFPMDPLGSYTGRPWNEEGLPEEMLEMPVQDADDL